MRKGNITREEAISIAGIDAVENVETKDCDYTNRIQTDGDEGIEFSSSVIFIDEDDYERTLITYYYQYQEDIDAVENNLELLDWTIYGYEII